MEALNNEERKSATLKFLGLFSVTFVVLAIAMFLMSYVPTSDIQVLKEDSDNLRLDTKLASEVAKITTNLNTNFAKYNAADINLALEGIIKSELEDTLKPMIKKQNLPVNRTLQNVYDSYMLIYQAKQDLKKYSGSKDKIGELTNDKNDLQDKLKECQTDRDYYKSKSATPGG